MYKKERLYFSSFNANFPALYKGLSVSFCPESYLCGPGSAFRQSGWLLSGLERTLGAAGSFLGVCNDQILPLSLSVPGLDTRVPLRSSGSFRLRLVFEATAWALEGDCCRGGCFCITTADGSRRHSFFFLLRFTHVVASS